MIDAVEKMKSQIPRGVLLEDIVNEAIEKFEELERNIKLVVDKIQLDEHTNHVSLAHPLLSIESF